jgi:hypothetical protein
MLVLLHVVIGCGILFRFKVYQNLYSELKSSPLFYVLKQRINTIAAVSMGLFSKINNAIDGIGINDYLQFQGISLGESIDTFQSKLLARGWKLESQEGMNGKSYSGTFAEKKATLAVSFNAITRKIAFVMVILRRRQKQFAIEEVNENVQKILERYQIKPNFVEDGPQEDGAYYFELPHGRIICSMAHYIGSLYDPYIEYVNKPNNAFYVKERESDY